MGVKVEEFLNLRQGNTSVEEYSLKFTLLSMYAPSSVSNPRDEMNRFVNRVADLFKQECLISILHHFINLLCKKIH